MSERKSYELTKEDLDRLDDLLVNELGYRRLEDHEYKDRGLIPPRNLNGVERGYVYRAKDPLNEMEAVTWTTGIRSTGEPRPKGTDTGKNLIRYKGKARYHAKPTLRTKNYVDNMYWKARANKERIDNRPKDTFKGDYMLIEQGKGNIHQRYWMSVECNKYNGGRYEKVGFDYGLSPETQEHVKKRRKKVSAHNEKLRAAGKEPGGYVRNRIPWKEKVRS
jgi:hypothetical protein